MARRSFPAHKIWRGCLGLALAVWIGVGALVVWQLGRDVQRGPFQAVASGHLPRETDTAPPPSPPSPTVTVGPSHTPTASLTPTPSPSPTWTPTPTQTPTATLPPLIDGGSLTIGYSVEGRPLTVYRFGQGPRQRMIIGGIHGGYEWNTVALVEALLERLRNGAVAVPEDVSLFVLPNLNPDGYARHKGIFGRANARGVDLNRNFAWNWAPDWNRAGCWNAAPITAGAGPFSEPETRALRDFLLRPDVHLDALVSYHSAALGVFPAGYPDHQGPRSTRLAQAIARVTGYRYPPAGGGCQLTGQLVDWVAFTLDVPAVDVELSTHHDLDLEQNLAVLRLLLTLAWPTPTPTFAPPTVLATPSPTP